MNTKYLHRGLAALVFVITFWTYASTIQPSVPFWDCGEFSAATTWQQVPHPPGAPLFLMVGKIFQDIIPFGDLGWKVNLVSVTASAFSSMLLYLVIAMVIFNFRKVDKDNIWDTIAVYGSAVIGALAFTYCDTQWFNSVESEVYASSTLFVMIILYLMMRWNVEADKKGHERYLLLIAYMIGLSTGVHLLAILTIFTIALVVYYRKYKFNITSFLVMGGISIVVFFIIYPVIIKWVPAFLAGHTSGKTDAREYAIDNNPMLTLLTLVVIFGAIATAIWGYIKKHRVLTLASSAFVLIILGYTTYTQILLRSNANPPMNENEPKNFSVLASYLGREQYGDAPMWPRRYQTDDYFVDRYTQRDNKGNYVYGEWYPPERAEAHRKDGSSIVKYEFNHINSSAELSYMWQYQLNHMYWRYFGWNFIGRNSDVQDAGVAWFGRDKEVTDLNYDSGYKDKYPVQLFALPFLIGFIGLFFHFWKDPKMAFAYIILFLVMGVLAALQQNQQDPQPRERDYFYTGSFLVWCLWIGLGSYSWYEILGLKKMTAVATGGILLVSAFIVPINMAYNQWFVHSRAGNWLPFDYSYNILQSTDKDAILFTNGDNDTFPVWYLQDVAGVRRDVRVVNLSLGNTLWYIDQLKNREPWGAKKIPLSFADDSLRVEDETDPGALSYDFAEPHEVSIPVKKEILEKYTKDPEILARGTMQFRFDGKPYGERQGKKISLIRIQDKLVLDILQQIRFERPVYFSNTVGPDAWCGLESFFRYEGMAMRICPVPQTNAASESMDADIMEKCLMHPDNSDNYSKEPKFGFKLRNLNNPNVYYDEVHRRLMTTYRSLYMSYAVYNLRTLHNNDQTIKALDVMNDQISYTQFPMSYDLLYRVAKIYDEAGAKDKAKKFAEETIKASNVLINNQNLDQRAIFMELLGRREGPYRVAANMYEMLGNYQSAKETLNRLLEMSQAYRQQLAGASPQDTQGIDNNIMDIIGNLEELDISQIEKEKGKQAALDSAQARLNSYSANSSQQNFFKARYLMKKINELKPATDTSKVALNK